MDIKDSYLHGTVGVVKSISVDADKLKYKLADVAGTVREVTLPTATTSANGLMSSGDKTKLDNLSTTLGNYVTLNTDQDITGTKTFTKQLKFTVAKGTAPFLVTSDTKVTNLNADLLDGIHSTGFIRQLLLSNTNPTTFLQNIYKYKGEHLVSIRNDDWGTLTGRNNLSWGAGLMYIQNNITSTSSTIGGGLLINLWGGGYLLTCRGNTSSSSIKADEIVTESKLSDYNVGTADKLKTSRKLWGLDFDGSADVSGDMTGVGNITISATNNKDYFINFLYNSTPAYSWRLGYLGTGSGDTNYFVIQSSKAAGTSWSNAIRLDNETLDAVFGGNVYPLVNNTKTLGTSSLKWSNVYATTFSGSLSGNASSATQVIMNLHISNDTDYPIVWTNSNNTTNAVAASLFKSYAHLTYNPKTKYVKAGSFLCDNWFRSTGNTGWHNPTNLCHIHPNNVGSYGGMIICGEKGSYHGALLGTSKNYMCLMSNDVHHGLYCETNGLWEFYYSRSSKSAGVLTSTLLSGFALTVGGATHTTFLTTGSERYNGDYGLNLANSDIVGVNALYTNDNADNGTEGLQFSRGNGYYDSLWASGGALYFSPNGNLNRSGSYSNNYTVWHSGNDGSGSGLDADKVDGYNAIAFEGYYGYIIDASSLDNNTWYPVTIAIDNSIQTRIRVLGHTRANASWNSRSDKYMAVILDYTVNGSHWGWTTVQRVVHRYELGAGIGGTNCVAGLGLLSNSSTEYVYVRGGAAYYFYISRAIQPVLRTSTYTISSQSVGPTTSSPSRITLGYHSFNLYASHFYENSDITLKTNIETINTSDNIPQLKSFDWKEDSKHSYGLIAQELEEMGYTELVEEANGKKTVNYSAALSLIVGKLQVKIRELEEEIENLKNKN